MSREPFHTFRDIFRVKPIDSILHDAEKPEFQLRRAIGPVQLTLFGISAIIGAGIFATIGTAAAGDSVRPGSGPALMLSFLITAVVCSFTALCYAEFSSMVPISGSAYTYSYATLGEIVAWVIGWDLIIEYAVGNIAVAISWANYFKTLLAGFGIHIPDWMSMDYRTAARIVQGGESVVFRDAPHVFGVPIVFNFLAIFIVAAISVVLIWGIRESARFNMVMVGIKIVVLIFFIVVGFLWVKPANWTPFAPNGWSGIGAGAAIVFFAYIGFDAVSTVAEETRNPQKNLPIGIIASLGICTLFYIVVSAVFTGLISYTELHSALATEQAEPLTLALAKASPDLGWAVGIVAFGSVVAHTAVLLVFQMGQPRIFFSMARDGLLPPMFHRVHPRFRTPWVSTIVTGVFVAGFASIASIDEMVDLTNIGTLFAFILVCAGIIVMKVRHPGMHRPFRVPSGARVAAVMSALLVPAVWFLPAPGWVKCAILAVGGLFFFAVRRHILPVLGILSCFYLIYYLPPTSWLRFAAWLNLGILIYAGYGSVHSRLTGAGASQDRARHALQTARTGTALAAAGIVLLFLTHGLDILLMESNEIAFVSQWNSFTSFFRGAFPLSHPCGWMIIPEAGSAWAKMKTLAVGVWSSALWSTPSVFLTAPLGLTGFALCPLMIRRLLKARGPLRQTGGRVEGWGAPLGFAVGLMGAIALYFALVVRFGVAK